MDSVGFVVVNKVHSGQDEIYTFEYVGGGLRFYFDDIDVTTLLVDDE